MTSPQKRPSSIDELVQRARDRPHNASRSLNLLVKDAEQYNKLAKVQHAQCNYEEAFVNYTKAATIILEELPQHRDNNILLSDTQKNDISGYSQTILDALSELKPILVDRYEKWHAAVRPMCQDAPGALSYRTNSPRLPSWLASFELATSQDPPSLLSHRTHSPSPSWLESSKLSNGEDTLSTLSHRTPSSPWLASFELATSHDTPDTLRYRTPSPPWLASFELATNHNAPNTPPYRTPSPHLPSWLASFELATNQDAPSTLSYRSPTSHAVPSSPSMSEQNFPPNSTSQLPPSFIDRSYNTSNPYPLQSKSKLAAPWNASAMSYPQVQNRTDRSPSVVHQSMKGGTDDPDFLMPSLSASNTTLTQGDQRMPGVVDLTNKIRIIENEKLGVGGFSEVFKAIYNINQCTTGVVAVKKLTITNFKSRSVTEAASRLKKVIYASEPIAFL